MSIKLGTTNIVLPFKKAYLDSNLVYQKGGGNVDTEFTSCPFPTEWTVVITGTEYKATNDYGEWKCTATDQYNTVATAEKAFDGKSDTIQRFKQNNFPKYIAIDLPIGISIKPLKTKIIYKYMEKSYLQGFNPNSNEWEDLLTLPQNKSTSNLTTMTSDINTSNFYTKFRIKVNRYSTSSTGTPYIHEFQITEGNIRKKV